MKLKDLKEAVNKQVVYHVTFSKNVKKITTQGLTPLQTSNWIKRDGENRYNEEGGVFAFEHPKDAFLWAFKQQFEFKKNVAIIKLKRGDSWEVDPSQDIDLLTGQGKSLRSIKAIPSTDVIKSFELADFKNPTELKISQGDWIQGIINKLSE